MGSINSVMDEQKQQRMQDIITDFTKEFSTVFPLSYQEALIESAKEEAEGEEEDERQLPDAPDPDGEVKSGTIIKQCAFRGNWKPNYFVALNKADNFRIDYFESEGGAHRGSINCCGYSVKDVEEGHAAAPHGLQIYPEEPTRRTYYLKFETEEEKKEWLQVIENACSKAEPPEDEDKLVAKAFKSAYRVVRWHYGYYGWYRVQFTEAEQLGELCARILYRELINDVINDIPAGALRNPTEKLVRKFVEKSVMTAVGSVWGTVAGAAKASKSKLEEQIKGLLTPIFDEQNKIKTRITELTNAKVSPFISDVGGRFCEPLLAAVAEPITKAYVAAIEGFSADMKEKMNEGKFETDKYKDTIKYVLRTVDYWWSGPLGKSNQICWDLYWSDLSKMTQIFGSGFSSYSLYLMATDSIRDLTRRGIHAFAKAIEENDAVDRRSALHEVFMRYVHDAKLALKQVLIDILGGVLSSPTSELLFKPAETLVAPIQSVIDAIPVPGLSSLLNLTSLTEETLQGIVDENVATFVESAYGKVERQLETAGSKVDI